MRFFQSGTVLPISLVLAMSLLVSGCATTQYGEQITTVNYYPQCYSPINDLREADKDYNKTIVGGAAAGVLVGALVGFLATGKAEGALVGGAVGGAAGAGAGYAKAKQDRYADDNQRMASYLQDIDGDISGLDRATAAARVARICYDKEFKSAVAVFKQGKMTRYELDQRYIEINNGITEASNILGTMITSAGQREEEYQQALSEESRKANQPVPVVAARTPSKSATSEKAPAKARKSPTKTQRASRDDASLQAVAQNTQRLNESRLSAQDEQAAMSKARADNEAILAALTS